MWFHNVIYAILKDQNGRIMCDENLSFLDMMESHVSSILRYQCGANICNINSNIAQNIGGVTLVAYFRKCDSSSLETARVGYSFSILKRKCSNYAF